MIAASAFSARFGSFTPKCNALVHRFLADGFSAFTDTRKHGTKFVEGPDQVHGCPV
jgi:hypothetical protein